MKKFITLFALALLASPFVASADVNSYGGDCNPPNTCQAGLTCNFNTNQCDCPSGQAWNSTNTTCEAAPGNSNPNSANLGNGTFVPLAPIPGLTQGVDTTSASMTLFLNNLYKFLIGFAAAAAVVEIIWGGLEYATTDNIGHKSEGKARIQQAILGLVLVLLPVLVFSIINPRILDLGVNWKTIALPSNSGGTGSNAQFVGGTNGTATTNNPLIRNGAVVVTEVFATDSEVQQFVRACDSSSTNFFGYFKGGLPGWFSSGSQCTNTNTVTSGSDVSTQCTNYQFTGYCSQVKSSLFLNLPQGGIFTTGYSSIVDDFGGVTYNVPANALGSAVYLDTATQQFVNGCKSDQGVLTYEDPRGAAALANCPAGNTLRAGTKCFTTAAVYCRISN